MLQRLLMVVALLFVWIGTAAAQNPAVTCTDETNTNCTVKKNAPFSMTADPALPTDTVLTEKWKLYQNGTSIAEQVNTGIAPVFTFASGLSVAGPNTFYLEAIGHAYDTNGTLVEIASGPSNIVSLTVVTGSLSAPKNLRIVR